MTEPMHHQFTHSESAALSAVLQSHLQFSMMRGTINEYLVSGYTPGQWLYLLYNTPQNRLLCIRSAYQVWLSMQTQHRRAVLQKFQLLLKDHFCTYSTNGKTLLFCAVFIHELAPLLIQTTFSQD